MHNFTKNIKQLRQEKGWSQGDFAEKLGISVPAFSKIENGITDVNLSRMEDIAKMLGMSLVGFLSFGSPLVKNNEVNELPDQGKSNRLHTEQILNLQKQVIALHEELRKINVNTNGPF